METQTGVAVLRAWYCVAVFLEIETKFGIMRAWYADLIFV